jgi:AcrR family transcriptional regulator
VAENAITPLHDVAARVAAHTLSKRSPRYTDEVRRLLDAAFAVMAEHGTTSRVRVADIVARAGMSNDTFYRHFPSKEALVVALLEDGTDRLASYIAHQMSKEATPEGKVRRWVEGVMSQTREREATTTLAILWNGSSVGTGAPAGRHNPSIPLATLLVDPFAGLGSATPEMDASLVAHATLGKVSDYLWATGRPTRDEIERITVFCIDAATPRPAPQ